MFHTTERSKSIHLMAHFEFYRACWNQSRLTRECQD
ncbi:hypothetical protein BofuT4_uP080080.1 [Botrytis cinerea T4]|uniref:Uncharacterized protein n=1 Tax=Botryotinia fuckeliana (strain T4) TaxID=999810 RepID=G2YKR5_BOTF4|nr:hypothetical protein BofuT4_uP080080.1 [Botrytis cinerea T4]